MNPNHVNVNSDIDLFNRLNNPFPYDAYGVNYEGQTYISQQSVADRLNEALGIFNWELDLLEINVDMESYSVSVLGCLRIFNPETQQWVTRKQYGNATMTILKKESEPRSQAIEDAKKSAISDALKKTASWIGVAADIYQGKIKAVSSNDPRYNKLLSEFKLNKDDHKNGIVILPYSYKEYYEANRWTGIFESDIPVNPGSYKEEPKEPNKRNKRPQEYRMKALGTTQSNSDGTCWFEAMLQSREIVKVFVPADLAHIASNSIAPDVILTISGWYNERNKNINVASKSKLKFESSETKAS